MAETGASQQRAALTAIGVAAASASAMVVGMWLAQATLTGLIIIAIIAASSGLTTYMVLWKRARAISAVAQRLHIAAKGDFQSPVPQLATESLPDIAGAMSDLFSRTRSSFDSIQNMAMIDSVTGLPNRSSFCDQVGEILQQQTVEGSAAIFFIDLDGFKAINDTLGHAMGDQLLRRVAARLKELASLYLRAGVGDAIVGRFAGDEFTMFFRHMPPEISALKVAREVQAALSEAYILHSSQVEIGASIGVAFYPEHGATLSTLLRAADHAMYEAKNKGRRRVQLYSDDLEIRIAGKAETERDLKRALLQDEFFLEFQPQVDFASGRVVGAEALVRWAHPDGTVWLPGAFLPIAEESGVIVDLGRWVVTKACETIARIQSIGLDHRIAVNISRREIKQPGFFAHLPDAMERYGVAPHLIELELSETLIMQLDEETLGKLTHLRRAGTRIVIDDFGTGLSNLARLKDLPIDRVKIDRSLVRDITLSVEARMICAAVVALVGGLGLEIVVEGVENEEQIEMLRVMGCTIFQGFHLSRPVEESRFFESLCVGLSVKSA